MFEKKKEFKLITKRNPKSLLPNALTIFSVCLGLSSIKFSLDANYVMAIIAIGFAAILDTLDGRVARLIKGTSKVGKELDSLTDVISFGVAPGFIMYFWALNEIGKFGWMFVLIYTVCCALRLARFNLMVIEENETWKINFFEGVPSPAAAGLVLLPLILNLSGLFQFENYALLSSITILTTSILMVSKIPTYSLKRILIPRHLAIFLLLGIGVYVSLLIFYTFETLFFTGLIYIILIPIELMGLFVKPFALAMRLAANMTGGHIALLALLSLMAIFGEMFHSTIAGVGVAFVAIPISVAISALEIIVVLVQAYVFTLLTSVFVGMAINVHH